MMNLNLSPCSRWLVSSFTESELPSFSGKFMKILVVAALAFGLLAACYAAGCRCFVREITTVSKKNPPPAASKTDPNQPTTKVELKAAPLQREEKKTEHVEIAPKADSDDESDPFVFFEHEGILPLESEVPPVVMEPEVPKVDPKPLEDPKQKELAALKDKIRQALQEKDLNADKLKALIVEYSQLSLYMPLEFLPTYEEILKTFATRLLDAVDSKASWDKLSPIIELIWTMQDYNPVEKPENKDVRERVLKLEIELFQADRQMKSIANDRKTAEQCYGLTLGETKAMLAYGLSDDGKRLMREQQQKAKTERDEKIKKLDEQVDEICQQLKALAGHAP